MATGALALIAVSVYGADLPADGPALMPLPAEWRTVGGEPLSLTAAFRVSLSAHRDQRLENAIQRALTRLSGQTGLRFSPEIGTGSKADLVIDCGEPSAAIPRLGEDESYSLEITDERALLRAPSSLGVLRGLETFLQLAHPAGAEWRVSPVEIRDFPRFPWRGLMIDVVRHWQPMDVVKRNIDAMVAVKLNVLHLHLTDDQGFRIESRTHPELHEKGSDGHFFTQAQMRELLAYAHERGIRVVPEFDIPGHATSWLVSHPELGSQPGPYEIERGWGIFDPVLDPTNEATYALLEDFLGEMAALFPDPFLHIGGDENNGVHWNANSRIQAFIREHKLKDNEGLHAYFNQRIADILHRNGKRLVGWDEILHPNLPKGSVVHSWRGTAALAKAAQLGYAGILSNGFYIDLNHPASEHYATDPLPADSPLNEDEKRHILGGEATMWTEWVTPDLIDTRIWPRTAAIAERLWSPRDVRDEQSMYRRLERIDGWLVHTGVRHRDWPRFEGVPPKDAAALRIVADAVEPVKRYQRGALQPEHRQATPLNQLVDWARPESRTGRKFDAALQAWVLAEQRPSIDAASKLQDQLRVWRDAARRAEKTEAPDSAEGHARHETARLLGDLCHEALAAIEALAEGKALPANHRTRFQELLERAQKPTAAAVQIPFVRSLRLLMLATDDPSARNTPSPAVWRQRMEAAAAELKSAE